MHTFTLHGKLFQWVDDKVEEITAEDRPQLADVSMESINHVSWVDEDPDQILFVRVTEKGVQVELLRDASHLAVGDESCDNQVRKNDRGHRYARQIFYSTSTITRTTCQAIAEGALFRSKFLPPWKVTRGIYYRLKGSADG